MREAGATNAFWGIMHSLTAWQASKDTDGEGGTYSDF